MASRHKNEFHALKKLFTSVTVILKVMMKHTWSLVKVHIHLSKRYVTYIWSIPVRHPSQWKYQSWIAEKGQLLIDLELVNGLAAKTLIEVWGSEKQSSKKGLMPQRLCYATDASRRRSGGSCYNLKPCVKNFRICITRSRLKNTTLLLRNQANAVIRLNFQECSGMFLYKFVIQWYLIIGLQRNTSYSKSNQRVTATTTWAYHIYIYKHVLYTVKPLQLHWISKMWSILLLEDNNYERYTAKYPLIDIEPIFWILNSIFWNLRHYKPFCYQLNGRAWRIMLPIA